MKKIMLFCFILFANSFISNSMYVKLIDSANLEYEASKSYNYQDYYGLPFPINQLVLRSITSDNLKIVDCYITAEYSKYGNSFFATTFSKVDSADSLESDSTLSFQKNDIDSMSVEMVESPTGYNKTYLYSFDPFPLPATTEIRTLLYWDPRIDIDINEIAVYDIYGARVSGKENIYIEKHSTYNGYLIWDCSAFANRTYLIYIIYGTNSMIVKVLVKR